MPADGVGGAAGPGRGRIEGLYLWRVLLMIFGVMYHGVMLRPETPVFTAVTLLSNSSRMGLFFGMSGLVVAHSLDRHAPATWLSRRLLGIGVPTAFGLLVICPLTALSLQLVPPAQRLPNGFPQWYHVWFLVALLLYAPVAYALHRLDARRRVFAAIEADPTLLRHAQPAMLLAIPLVSFALMQAIMMLVMAATPVSSWFPLFQLRPTAGYLPMFLLGFAMGRSDRLRLATTRRLLPPLLIVAAVATAYLAWYLFLAARVPAVDRVWMQAVLLEAGGALGPPALLVPVIRSAYAIRTTPPWLRRLSAASFTIYLVHFPIVLAINGLFARVAWNEYGEWAVAVAVTLGLSYALHAGLVRRSPLAALLLNGVLPARRRQDVAAAAPAPLTALEIRSGHPA